MNLSMDDHKNLVQAQFARAADAYVTSAVHAFGADRLRMVALAALTGSEDVLDVATGAGHTVLAFAPHVGSVVASDITPEMLSAARDFLIGRHGLTNVTFEIADAEDLPFADATFNVVTCRSAPHHFSRPEAFVGGVARVLFPGGRFVLVDSTGHPDPAYTAFIDDVERRRDPSHYCSYTPDQWRAWAEASGLTVAHSETFLRHLDFDDWTGRMHMATNAKAALERDMIAAAEHLRRHYNIEVWDGRVVSFTLDTLLMLARKP